MSFTKVTSAAAAATLLLGGSLSAAPPVKGDGPEAEPSTQSSSETPPGQLKRPADPDMGDEMAALAAKLQVCSKETPAADRSAICPAPEEPVSY